MLDRQLAGSGGGYGCVETGEGGKLFLQSEKCGFQIGTRVRADRLQSLTAIPFPVRAASRDPIRIIGRSSQW